MAFSAPSIQKVLLVGCGNMGLAVLRGWLTSGVPSATIEVVDRHTNALDDIQAVQRPRLLENLRETNLTSDPICVVLAVKPQVAMDALRQLSDLARGSIVLSIAAGVTISTMTQALPPGVGVVRAMPNLPATIVLGTTVAVASPDVTAAQHDLCDGLLSAAGKVLWITDEGKMDAVTALSGNGPAYVFLLLEALTKVGTELGLTPELAAELAKSTVLGSATLASQSSETAATLRQQVTSPGGTTEAALNILMQSDALMELFRKAMVAGRDRSIELSRRS